MELIYKNTSQTTDKLIISYSDILLPYLEKLKRIYKEKKFTNPESAINFLSDEPGVQKVFELQHELNQKTNQLKLLIVIGIGGANLGSKAIYDAFLGFFDNLAPLDYPKVIYIDTIHPGQHVRLKKYIETMELTPNEILINVISRSGTTLETNLNFQQLLEIMPQLAQRVIVTTKKDTPLWQLAHDQNMHTLEVPEKVSGRFSVFSAIGLLPMLLSNLDIIDFIEGGIEALHNCLNKNLLENPAIISASIIYNNYRKKHNLYNLFTFHPELETLGKWNRQLMAESLGKEVDTNNKPIHTGITPFVSIGTIDLHSTFQLYMTGPKDKMTCFLWCKNIIETNPTLKAILTGVKIAYTKRNLQYYELVLPNLSMHSLGNFMQYKMLETMFLAQLLNINAFDQPAVEEYKAEAKKYLKC